MLAKTTSHRQRYWLKHVEAADLSDSTIAEYATANDVSLKGLYQELRDKMVDGCNNVSAGRHFKEMAAQRDRGIVAILNAIKESQLES